MTKPTKSTAKKPPTDQEQIKRIAELLEKLYRKEDQVFAKLHQKNAKRNPI